MASFPEPTNAGRPLSPDDPSVLRFVPDPFLDIVRDRCTGALLVFAAALRRCCSKRKRLLPITLSVDLTRILLSSVPPEAATSRTSDGASLRVRVRSGTGEEDLMTLELAPGDTGGHRVDFGTWAGQQVELSFPFYPPPPRATAAKQ